MNDLVGFRSTDGLVADGSTCRVIWLVEDCFYRDTSFLRNVSNRKWSDYRGKTWVSDSNLEGDLGHEALTVVRDRVRKCCLVDASITVC